MSTRVESSAQVEPLFVIDLDDASVINKVLWEISNPKDNSLFIFSKEGLRVEVNGDRTSQVSVFFPKTIFTNFVFKADSEILYKSSLKEFIEILDLLRDDESDEEHVTAITSMKMFYVKRGEPLRLRLQSGCGYALDCDLVNFNDYTDRTLMGFTDCEESADIEFNSRELYKYISGLDLANSKFVTIVMEHTETPVKMVLESSNMGEVELEIMSEVVRRKLVGLKEQVLKFNYKSEFLAPALEACKNSTYVRMKCGTTGLMLLEHHFGQQPRVQSVQYFVLSEVVT